MKKLPLLAVFFVALGMAIPCQAEPPTPIAWRACWIPWHDVYASWDWRVIQGPLFCQWANSEKIPGNVTWEFAVCRADDPSKIAREPLQPPLSVEEITWHLERWTPGNFPTDHLATLADGTFLCAILANGQRISNVSRVTINHAGEPPLTPGIRISPLILFTPNIDTLAIRIIPKPDWHTHYFDLQYPFLSFDGVWAQSGPQSFEGVNSDLKPGNVYGMVTGFNFFIPTIKPFQQASVQAKFTKDALHIDNWHLNTEIGPDPAMRMKNAAKASPGYLSEITLVKFDDTDIRTFDTAFSQK